MSRKMVTIRTVSDIQPIPGADAIECLTVEGWKVVSQKGNFQVGDLCVYLEIDSFLPDGNPLWQDLVDKSSREFEGRKGHVLRTIKLRGTLSQGLCIPLREFHSRGSGPYGIADMFNDLVLTLGREDAITNARELDFADVVRVVKYEPPIAAELAGQVKGLFPSFIRKTDQQRAQNLAGEIFADLDAKYEVTVKLDGTSMTVYNDPDGIGGVCSRNLELNIVAIENDNNTMVKYSKESGLLKLLESHPHIAVQGELMGPGLQGNRENLRKPIFFIFDLYDITRGQYLTPVERADFLLDKMDHVWAEGHKDFVRHVPILHHSISLRELGISSTEELLAFAEGKSLTHDIREGVVFKRVDGQFSFKAVSNKFLIKQKD